MDLKGSRLRENSCYHLDWQFFLLLSWDSIQSTYDLIVAQKLKSF